MAFVGRTCAQDTHRENIYGEMGDIGVGTREPCRVDEDASVPPTSRVPSQILSKNNAMGAQKLRLGRGFTKPTFKLSDSISFATKRKQYNFFPRKLN